MNQLNQPENLYLNLHMKIKDNDYYEKLYVRLLKAYDLKRNNHTQVELYNIYAKKYNYMNGYDYKKYIYMIFLIIIEILKLLVSSLIQKKNC